MLSSPRMASFLLPPASNMPQPWPWERSIYWEADRQDRCRDWPPAGRKHCRHGWQAWIGSGTHKDFHGGVAPIRASGLHDAGWIERLRELVENRFSTECSQSRWCKEADQPWRVISCLYHVLSAYDAAYLPYPWPEKVWARLIRLDYGCRRDELSRTSCTDFDYIHLLYRLTHQMPDRFGECLIECRSVFHHRREEWNGNREKNIGGGKHP